MSEDSMPTVPEEESARRRPPRKGLLQELAQRVDAQDELIRQLGAAFATFASLADHGTRRAERTERTERAEQGEGWTRRGGQTHYKNNNSGRGGYRGYRGRAPGFRPE